ncbi:hypothetical protein P3W85_29680 [Cupriavidus basilensis]|uniref:Uncharacterized protein n=1 Tax=Cupriavidus basilensis TaxID=68895 RepID=A0ABT6AWY3_9BURK|nr:hypothetical protein [Cupriavidus basilensis]MDF3837093.1 hypothetical protein [Cupriavidus basilensis]
MQNIDKLREHLFATLEGLRDKKDPVSVELAKAVAEVSQTIINSAKVEVEYLKATGGKGSSRFLEGARAEALPAVAQVAEPIVPAPNESKAEPAAGTSFPSGGNGILSVTRHIMKG